MGGEKRFAMRLWLDSEKMAARGVTVLDVQGPAPAECGTSSGRVENLDREMTMTRGEPKTTDEFNQLVVRADGANSFGSRDVGRAEAGVEDYRTIARARGKPCIFMGIVKQAKANTVSVAQRAQAELASLQPTLSRWDARCGWPLTAACLWSAPLPRSGRPWPWRSCW